MSSIKDIKKIGGHFKGLLLVKSCEEGIATNSKNYLTIMFQDLTGILDAKKWEVLEDDIAILTPGFVVDVEGDVFSYRNNMQMKVLTVKTIDQNTINLADYVSSSPISIEELKSELAEFLGRIGNDDIRILTETLIKDNYDSYTSFPAASTFHHSFFGGILFHSLSIARMASDIQKRYDYLNLDYLIAGALLHDIGKTIELSGIIGTQYTTKGKLLGHISIGSSLIHETANRLGITSEVPTVLEHMVLSHHGNLEFGSPVAPKTVESYVLHSLDDLDSKLNMLENALKAVDEGEFTLKVNGFDGRQFYKPMR